jgi:hypothetical protein
MFDAGQLINDLKILSADDMGGRAPDTPGHDKALQFLLRRYSEIGLSSFEGSFEQKYDFVFSRAH